MASKVSLFSDLGALIMDRVCLQYSDVDQILDATLDLSAAASFLEQMVSGFRNGFEASYPLDRILFEGCVALKGYCAGSGFSGGHRRRDLVETVISVGDYRRPGHPVLRFCVPDALKDPAPVPLFDYDRAFAPYDMSGRRLPRAMALTGVSEIGVNGRQRYGPGLKVSSFDIDCERTDSDTIILKPFGALYLVKAK